MAYYKGQGAPGDQNALVNLLREALGVKESFLLAVIRRIPTLRLGDSHCLELCGGPNCSKRAQLAAFVERNWGSNPKKFQLKYVPCMRLCGKGPNIRWDGKIYHGANEALLKKLIEEADCND